MEVVFPTPFTPRIRKRLIVTGELDSLYKFKNIKSYDTTLQHAIIKFQLMHGLLADGVIGYNTINQLNISYLTKINNMRQLLCQKRGPVLNILTK